MRIIFDLGHPAHFHLFKNVISILNESNNDIEIVAREKDCLVDLLNRKGFGYISVPKKSNNLFSKGFQNLKAFSKILSLARKKKTDFIVGTSLVAGPVSRLTKAKSIIFNEDDADVVPMFARLSYPFAHYIVTPNSLNREDHGKKHIRYQGYHELAYLHPERFTSDSSIIHELKISKNQKYFLVRLVSLTAHHDVGQKGLGTEQAKVVIKHLEKYGRVFISAEKTIDEDLKTFILPTSPEKILDVMAFADLVIGDSQTMTAESAILGTPAIRCNSFIGRISYLEELEHKYGLAFGFKPDDFEKLLEKIDELLSQDNIKYQWQQKREKMLSECVDLTEWMINLFNKLSAESISNE